MSEEREIGPSRLLRADLLDHGIVLFIAETTKVCLDAEWRHLAGRVSAVALARLITGAVLAGGFLEGSERLTLKIKTESALKGVTAEVDATGHVRGYPDQKILERDREPPKDLFDIGRDGWLQALRATDDRITYQGTVPLAKGDVISDVLRLIRDSEQRVAHLDITVDYEEHVVKAGGILVQGLHDVKGPMFDRLTRKIATFETREVVRSTFDVRGMLERLLPEAERGATDIKFERPLSFRCRCSRQKVRSMLASLGREELTSMLREDGSATINCHYCGDEYTFDRRDLAAIIAELP